MAREAGFPLDTSILLRVNQAQRKTTFALQFVAEGTKRGEKLLYVTLSESRDELLTMAAPQSLVPDESAVLEVPPNEQDLRPEGQYTVFRPAEVELTDRIQAIMAEVNRRKPNRLVIDAISEGRMVAKDPC